MCVGCAAVALASLLGPTTPATTQLFEGETITTAPQLIKEEIVVYTNFELEAV